jgi:mitogen-activated protein kinase kinase 7
LAAKNDLSILFVRELSQTLAIININILAYLGRLVDSKAKTRSAGCAAYMAPERIDPPHPSKPDYHYDIRADVWSLGITLVEMATGHFPYKDCKTDFEVLTKVLQDDPPFLPRNGGFSHEFQCFVRDCLLKNYKVNKNISRKMYCLS